MVEKSYKSVKRESDFYRLRHSRSGTVRYPDGNGANPPSPPPPFSSSSFFLHGSFIA
jgi:hypothetical protein